MISMLGFPSLAISDLRCASRRASTVPKQGISVIAKLWVRASPRCVFTMGQDIVILLAGGDKSTQSKDIKTALDIARRL